jgi:hypothetical protein
LNFIKENSNWRELLAAAPYYLKIKEDDNYILFKYDQQASDFSNPIVCEARGLILRKSDFKVVRMAFKKFFNVGEPNAAAIDWSSSTASMKIDGSLMSIWFDNGEWHCSTNNTINAKNASLNNGGYKTFYDLFKEAFDKYNIDLNNLNTNMCFTFELVSPFNKVVIQYDDIELYHILTVDLRNLNEIEVDIGIPKPQFFNLNSKEDYLSLVDSFDDTKEGIVVKDKFNRRLKIKTPLYFELHHLINNGVITLEKIVELILKNDDEEFLSYFVEYQDEFSHIRDVREKILARITEISYLTKKYSSKKEIALDESIPNWEKRFYFNAFDNKKNNLEIRDWCKLIKMWEATYNGIVEGKSINSYRKVCRKN